MTRPRASASTAAGVLPGPAHDARGHATQFIAKSTCARSASSKTIAVSALGSGPVGCRTRWQQVDHRDALPEQCSVRAAIPAAGLGAHTRATVELFPSLCWRKAARSRAAQPQQTGSLPPLHCDFLARARRREHQYNSSERSPDSLEPVDSNPRARRQLQTTRISRPTHTLPSPLSRPTAPALTYPQKHTENSPTPSWFLPYLLVVRMISLEDDARRGRSEKRAR